MSKKIKLDETEALLILKYYGTVYAEGGVILNATRKVMEKSNMFENDKIYDIYEKIENELFLFIKINMQSSLIKDLERMASLQQKYISSVDLTKFKIDMVEITKKLEQDVINFYQKIIELETDNKEIETSKSEVFKSIKNMYFLTDRIKEVIESKV